MCNECDVFRLAIDTFGEENQLNKTEEELLELAIALKHRSRLKTPDKYSAEIAEEYADVTIMLDQLSHIYGKHFMQDVISWRLIKLSRLQDECLKIRSLLN